MEKKFSQYFEIPKKKKNEKIEYILDWQVVEAGSLSGMS